MSEPRYPTRVSDPDETTRIPKDALDGLRDADQTREQGSSGSAGSPGPSGLSGPSGSSGPSGPDGSSGANGSSGSSDGFRNGSFGLPSSGSGVPSATSPTPAQRSGPPAAPPGGSRASGLNGYPSDGSPAVSPGGSGGSGRAAFGGSGSLGSVGPTGSAVGSGPSGGSGLSGSGFGGRSETGYSPSSYPSPYSSAYPSLGEPPTTVTGQRGAGAGLGAGGATAARSALGTAGAARPPTRSGPSGNRPARRARLLVRHIDPWSTLKFSFVLSVAMFFVWLVAVGVLYGVLDGMGVFEQINGLYDEVSGNTGDRLFSPGLVLGTATLIGAVNIVLFTALATIGAFVYNICSDLVGGIEVTLAERD